MTEAERLTILVEWLERAGWAVNDVHYSTTGLVESTGAMVDPTTGATFMSVVSAARVESSRSGAPPVRLPAPAPAAAAKPPVTTAVPPTPPVPPGLPTEGQLATYERKVEPLVKQLDQLCARLGISGLVLVEADNGTSDVLLLTTQLGAPPRSAFVQRVLVDAYRDE